MPKRLITCSKCGAETLHHSREMCRPCYLDEPDQLARQRWRHMVNRCTKPTDPAWKWYGARGIKVCDRWLSSFQDYYSDTGTAPDGMTLDRIDNDGDYEPANVRWATPQQQSQNQRRPQLERASCPQGHPYDELNTYLTPRGSRDCRTCRRAAGARARARRREQAAA